MQDGPVTVPKIDRSRRSTQKNQRAKAVWLTGLSGAGKSTLAVLADELLTERGHHTYVLDGDNLRRGLNKDLGFSDADRRENIRRVGELARLFTDAGIIVFVAIISPFARDRAAARALFPSGEFVEVYVNAPLVVCEQRDPKHFYARARKGEISDFTGVSSIYEAPQRPDLVLNTATESEAESVARLIDYLEQHGGLRSAEHHG